MLLSSVLIIDDSEFDRYILSRFLKDAEITSTIFESTNGQEALNFLCNDVEATSSTSSYPPPLIFVDINMPIMNGFEFLKGFSELLNTKPELTECTLVMFSSSENKSDRELATSYGFVKDYIIKHPESSTELFQQIKQHFPYK